MAVHFLVVVGGMSSMRAVYNNYKRVRVDTPSTLSRPYFYVGVPTLLCVDDTSRSGLAAFTSIRPYGDVHTMFAELTVSASHLPFLPSSDECLVLSQWTGHVTVYYARTGLFNGAVLVSCTGEERARLLVMLDTLYQYRTNSYADFFDFFDNVRVRPGFVYNEASADHRICRAFEESFATFGCAMPVHAPWRLFTGEGRNGVQFIRHVRALRDLCDPAATALIPLPLSTSWNFNVALYYAGEYHSLDAGPGLVVMHYRPRPSSSPIYAHFLQEIRAIYQFTLECEVLLQPRLRMRYMHEEVATGLELHSLLRPGSIELTINRLHVMHVEILPPDEMS